MAETEKKAPAPKSEDVKAELAEAMDAAQKAALTTSQTTTASKGVGVMRKRGSAQSGKFFPSDIPYPKEVHGEDFEFYGSNGFAAFLPEGTKVSAYSSEQEFMIDPEKVEVLWFQKAGRNLPKKRLYTIKGLHKDGRLRQFPFEDQIQNQAGGDPEDAIGLHRYLRKGIHLFIDLQTFIPVYCAAWGCFAQAADKGEFIAFCSLRHAMHTLPNKYKESDTAMMGMFSQGSTTSRVWGG